MEVIISHQSPYWKVFPLDKEYTLNEFYSSLEAKLFCNQNSYKVIKFECESGCKVCR